jgi:alpha-D-xyloside xylohydrolase
MQQASGFHQSDNTLIWRRKHETLQIEPWGHDSLRVRATMGRRIHDDLPGVLLQPAPTDAQIEVGAERAVIRNGAIAAI